MIRLATLLAVALLTSGGCATDGDRDAEQTREFGYVRSLDLPSRTLRFDRAQFVTGAAAGDAEYVIRNDDRRAVMLRLAPRVRVTRVQCRDSCRDGVPSTLAGLAASFERPRRSLNAPYRGPHSQYWLTTRDGAVVAIDEQYLP